jgi:RNA polymerase sigma-70 factor (ECF subfamily)
MSSWSALEPLRGELFRYCRRLTGSVWGAEDLAQETLARALNRAAQSHQPVEHPMAWLAVAMIQHSHGRAGWG